MTALARDESDTSRLEEMHLEDEEAPGRSGVFLGVRVVTTGGILLLDKPRGLTSNQALGRAKRVLAIRKAGHTGALDPLATGLLPLCFGEATKVSGWLLDADKSYLAEVRLGQTTDSGDADGRLLENRPLPPLDTQAIDRALAQFRGEIAQVPPMHSALKHHGRRLYELARAGVEVERPPRKVTIRRLELLDWQSPRLTLRVDCSKGTYIRSLAMDIGSALGCGAHLVALRRTRSGPFRIEQAIALDQLEELGQDDARARLLPADHALAQWPALRLDPEPAAALRQGRPVRVPDAATGLVRIYAGEVFLGVGETGADGWTRPRRLWSA